MKKIITLFILGTILLFTGCVTEVAYYNPHPVYVGPPVIVYRAYPHYYYYPHYYHYHR